jgi:hypothetical protein
MFPFLLLLLAAPLLADRFYQDDPIDKEPAPVRVEQANRRKLDDLYDLFLHSLSKPGEEQKRGKLIRAQGINTLGEVPDGAWYVNRHGRRPMTIEELVRGPGNSSAPDPSSTWKIISAKTQGITPGFRIQDAKGRRYLLKFDPLTNPEMATAADVVGSKFFYALGYHVPENYIVSFERNQLVVDPKTKFTDEFGRQRKLKESDVDEVLRNVPRGEDGRLRAVASLYLKGEPLLEFRYFATRTDDPNDIVRHEHRRDLRGLFVFCAWLGHDDSRAINTLDMLVEEGGTRFIRHHLIDFGSTLGSASTKANPARSGYTHFFEWKPAMAEFFSLGLHIPRWTRAHYPDLPSVGRFESQVFDPPKYKTDYPNPAFENRLPDDEFWAARQVMQFTDEQIRAIVKLAQYSDPKAEKWVADTLIARRDKIGRAFLGGVLALDQFEIRKGRLEFEDLLVKYDLGKRRAFDITWAKFDNASGAREPLGSTGSELPDSVFKARPGEYFVADIKAEDKRKGVEVYLRKKSDETEIVGIDRSW